MQILLNNHAHLEKIYARSYPYMLLATLIILLSGCHKPAINITAAANPVIIVTGLGEPSELHFILVTEGGDKKVWLISTDVSTNLENWPEIVYGVVPQGFHQLMPEKESPPPLQEGAKYGIMAADKGEGVVVGFFTYRNGKLVKDLN